jgi:NADPH:quinone reductase
MTMRGFITHVGGLRLGEFPEPAPAPGEFLMEVWAYSINPGEARLIAQRSGGFRPGQDAAGATAGSGSGKPGVVSAATASAL